MTKHANSVWVCSECGGRFIWSQTLVLKMIQRMAHLKTNCPGIGSV